MRTYTFLAWMLYAAGLYAQGTVIFDNNVPGEVVTHVYGPVPPDLNRAQHGNGPNDYPAGTTDWTGATGIVGAGFDAQLWAAPTSPGVVQPENSLTPALSITGFRTGTAGAGFLVRVTATLSGVPADAPAATLQLRVWDNGGGTLTSWDAAVAFGVMHGASTPFNVTGIGGGLNSPPFLQGLTSFNLFTSIPEPWTPMLVVFGGGIICTRRCLLRLVSRRAYRKSRSDMLT